VGIITIDWDNIMYNLLTEEGYWGHTCIIMAGCLCCDLLEFFDVHGEN
jgi:hypothetical protein